MDMLTRAFTIAAMALGPVVATAEDNPVVIELYTSQGCSSCPPADEILAELATRSDVIPLALHVDYWDYIGWKDEFADPKFTTRQQNYALAAQARTIYTPQFIVGGVDPVVGAHSMEVMDAVARHAALQDVVDFAASRSGGTVTVTARATGQFRGPLVLQLVRYIPQQSVSIQRGENAGKTISYSNIVTEWKQVANWTGATPLSVNVEVPGSDRVVLILQEPNFGRIVSAVRGD